MAVFDRDGRQLHERPDWLAIRAIMSESNKVSGLLASSRMDPDNTILRHRLETAKLHAARVREAIDRLLERLRDEDASAQSQ